MKRIVEVNLVLGIWLVLAPFALHYSHTARIGPTSNDAAIGVLLVICSSWILARNAGHFAGALVEMLCGIWLMVAPFALHTRGLPHVFRNDLTVGALVLIVSLAEVWIAAHSGHNQMAATRPPGPHQHAM